MSGISDLGNIVQPTAFKFLAFFVDGVDGEYIIKYDVRYRRGHHWSTSPLWILLPYPVLNIQIYKYFMDALSRREEDTLLKTTKARALKECDAVVKGPPHLQILMLESNLTDLRLR